MTANGTAPHDPAAPQTKRPDLVLGAVQLGVAYGAANRTGMPTEAEAVAIVRAAIAGGVRCIDTARAYGDSERRIGVALSDPKLPPVAVVTKLDPMTSIPADAEPRLACAAAAASLAASREALGRSRIDTLLLHRAEHRLGWSGAVWRMLCEQRAAGEIGTLGISVGTPGEALAALQDPEVAHIQLPFNILDRRWEGHGVDVALRRRPDVAVHVRSVFLQGLLAAPETAHWPRISGLDPAHFLSPLANLVRELGRADLRDLCIAFVRGQDWIDGIVIGVETIEQLQMNRTCFAASPLSVGDCVLVRRMVPRVPDALVDPSRWPKG